MKVRVPFLGPGLVAGLLLALSPLFAAPREEVAVIRTNYGEILFRFFDAEAPNHARYVRELIRRGFYDGTTFHRVIPHFVVQGGDPNSKDDDRSNDGDGEADRRLKAEFSHALHYRPGTVGMARDADPDSGSCQFFIALENLPRLDGRYTIFGEVISGLDVARRIADLPRDLKDNPLDRVEMKMTLRKAKAPDEVVSVQEGKSGEVLTGPGKPKPWDPGNVRWTPPLFRGGCLESSGFEKIQPGVSLDLAIGEDGSVLDARFGTLETHDTAAAILSAARKWKFSPALYDGKPVKARFSLDSHGCNPAPSKVPGTPVEAGGEVASPGSAVPVPLPAGAAPPEKEPILRLTVDETGRISDVSLQVSCGDPTLDEAAVAAARRMVFVPAARGKEPVPVYLTLPGRFLRPEGG
ncbi:MAG TPA: TonB family protein [Candidatus Polarisedimenticolia bacterium]|nr:TonB family protein [Candidatus Polarisedimenticolia bacterium]